MQKKLNLYTKFLGFLIKKGNKVKAKKILDLTFFGLSKCTKHSVRYILYKLFLRLTVLVEAKSVRIKRSRYIVPFPINTNRRSYLVIKWLMKAVLLNKKKMPFFKKLSDEILAVLKNSGSKALKFKVTNNKLALANRSNIHFRW